MRVRIDPPDLRDDLLDFLRASSCLGVKHGSSEIEAHLLNSVSERHDQAVLAGYVESWKARHGHASVEIVSGQIESIESRLEQAREGLVTDVWINGDVSGTLMPDADRDSR